MSELAVPRTATRIGDMERRDLLTVVNHPWLDELRRDRMGWTLEMTSDEALAARTLGELLCYAVTLLPRSPVLALPRTPEDEGALVAVVSSPRFGALRCDYSQPLERPDSWYVRLVAPEVVAEGPRLDAALHAAVAELAAAGGPVDRGRTERLRRQAEWRMRRVHNDLTVQLEGESYALPHRRPFAALAGGTVDVRAVTDAGQITALQLRVDTEVYSVPARVAVAAGGV
jgi:hypothetical protein